MEVCSSPKTPGPSALARPLFESAFRLRKVDEAILRLSREGVIRGSIHLANGQEALPSATGAVLRKDDAISMTYRNHGYAIAKGCDLRAVLAEICGRRTGLCHGKGGKMHLIDPENGVLGTNGIVAGGIPMAVGAALSFQRLKTEGVAVTVFGDGALNQGSFHESITFASLFRLPIVFLCENNGYAEMTPVADTTPVYPLTQRTVSYGIEATQVDGNDALAVHATLSEAVERARKGGGPTFVEAMTYRTCGHYQGDSETYRSREEVESWIARDPIEHLARILLADGVSEESLAQTRQRIEEEVADAVEFARTSPFPDPNELEDGLFLPLN